MSGLARLFCFSGGPPGGGEDWRSSAAPSGDTYAKAKVLDIVANEVDQRFARLHTQRVNQDAVPIRRLYKANLPAPEMNAAVDVLGKLCSIDDARESAETVRRWGQAKAGGAPPRPCPRPRLTGAHNPPPWRRTASSCSRP